MLFNSWEFILLLLVTLLIYYFPAFRKLQVLILILSSIFFYAFGQPYLLLLLLFSASINIFTSYRVINGNPAHRKAYAVTGVAVNLFILAFFKYSPLLSRSFLDTSHGLGYFLLTIPLPIGISFYTFEGISLLIDVYSNKHRDVFAVKSSLGSHVQKTLFFISFFPHLIAGPILKAYQFYPQVGGKSFRAIDWEYCFRKLTLGYFLKMVVADNLSNFTFWMAYPFFKVRSAFTLVAMLFGYSFQIFADFAGYSLIALGLAKLFGYTLMENFDFPYISTSFSEFWRRWHISLSTFLKEYLYISLGGNRKGRVRTYLNLMITMILGGLWHGAAWSYAVWGAFHGVALAIERLFNDIRGGVRRRSFPVLNGLLVFGFVTLAWLLFRLPFSDVVQYIRSIGTNARIKDNNTFIFCILIYSAPVVLYHLYYLLAKRPSLRSAISPHRYIAYAIMLFMIIVNSGPSGSFIYFQF